MPRRGAAFGLAPVPRLRSLLLALAMAIGFTMMGSFSTVQEGAKAELGAQRPRARA